MGVGLEGGARGERTEVGVDETEGGGVEERGPRWEWMKQRGGG